MLNLVIDHPYCYGVPAIFNTKPRRFRKLRHPEYVLENNYIHTIDLNTNSKISLTDPRILGSIYDSHNDPQFYSLMGQACVAILEWHRQLGFDADMYKPKLKEVVNSVDALKAYVLTNSK